MNWKDIYNKKKLTEVATSVEGGVNVTGQVHTFTGRSGQTVDGIFAGPYHPKFGDVKDELQQQLDDVYAKMEYSDINTPAADIDFEPMDIDIYSFDEVEANDKSNFVNDSEKNMKVIDLEMYNFDEVEENDKSNFISTSETNFQYINGDKI